MQVGVSRNSFTEEKNDFLGTVTTLLASSICTVLLCVTFTCTNILARCVIQSSLAVLNKAQIGIHHVTMTYCHGCQGPLRNTFAVCCSGSITPKSLSKIGVKHTHLDYQTNSNRYHSKGARCSTGYNLRGEWCRRMLLTLLECCVVVVIAGEAFTNRTLFCQVLGRILIRW